MEHYIEHKKNCALPNVYPTPEVHMRRVVKQSFRQYAIDEDARRTYINIHMDIFSSNELCGILGGWDEVRLRG